MVTINNKIIEVEDKGGRNSELFYRVYKNKYLKKRIIDFCRYETHRNVRLRGKDELLKYPFKDYISNLEYDANASMNIGDLYNPFFFIHVGDLPLEGCLKKIKINAGCISIDRLSIPNTVEKISLNIYPPPELLIAPTFEEDQYNQQLMQQKSFLSFGFIPESIEELKIGSWGNDFNVSILPKTNLKKLKYYYNSDGDEIVGGNLPEGILSFKIKSMMYWKGYCYGWNQIIDVGFFPNSLTILNLGPGWNRILTIGLLPPNLKSLVLGDSYRQPIIAGALPSALEKLKFSCDDYDQTIAEPGILPISLKLLIIPKYMKTFNVIHDAAIPKSTIVKLEGYIYRDNELPPI